MENHKTLTLKERIVSEMTVDYSNTLEKNFELAKQFIKITKGGKIDVLIKDRLTGKEKILVYLIGKIYAKEAGLSQGDYATNRELSEELGINMGSLLPWLKSLRDENNIKAVKIGLHSIHINRIESLLKKIQKKVEGNK